MDTKGEPSALKSGSTTHMPVSSSGLLLERDIHRTNAHGYVTPQKSMEKKRRMRATSSPRNPSAAGSVLTKMQSYRGMPFFQDGVARMRSRRMPLIPLGSLGAWKVEMADKYTDTLP